MAKTVANVQVGIFLVIVVADDDAVGCLCILISLSAWEIPWKECEWNGIGMEWQSLAESVWWLN